MKNNIAIMGVLLLLAAGCSKNQVEIIDDPQTEEDAWVDDLTLPVPIEFSSSGMNTKATPSGPIEGTVMDNLDIGIFALAVQDDTNPTIPYNQNPYTQIWNTDVPETVLLYNEHAVTGAEGSVTLDEAKYYPIESDYSYSFYSYYPYKTPESGDKTCVRILYDNIGYTDILWAKDDAFKFQSFPELVGFNAKYIRRLKQDGNYNEWMPTLAFKHVLTSLKVNAEIIDAVGTSNIRIETVKLKNTYKTAVLYVADARSAGDDNASGQIRGRATGEIILTKNIGTDGAENLVTDFSDVELSAEPVTLSHFLVLPSESFTFEVTYGIWDADLQAFASKKTAEYTLSNRAEMFEQGKRYNVNVELNDALEIEIKYTLTDWVNGGDAILTENE